MTSRARTLGMIFAAAAAALLAPSLTGSVVTITPASPALLVGQTLQLAAGGAVVPTAIATGAWHTCLLYSDQSVRCTGRNSQGEIGDGTFNNALEPVLAGGTVNPIQIRTGNEHTCTLVGDGTMQCWGTNYTGQLGDGTIGTYSLVPESVHNMTNAIKAVTGGFHTCAILSDHTVDCWGRNQDGQVGNGDSTTDVTLPVPVVDLGPVADLAAGGYHTCALMNDGTVRCWGRNGRGQLGDGTVDNSSTPVPVSGMTAAAVVSPGGYHTCALLQDGTVQCWGQNDWGQIGSPTLAFSAVPVTVAGLGTASAVAGGFYHTCAVAADGTVWCWGQNTYGELGDGSTTSTGTPVEVTGITHPRMIAAGGYHSCALMPDASVECWGEGDYGELGTGGTTNSTTPVKMNETGVTWASSDPTVATVDSTGLITAAGRGTATITATDPFGNSGSTTVTVRQMLTLSIGEQGDGVGVVTSSPTGIDCPGTCAASFISDSQVTLTAAPGAKSVFAGWTGCDSVSGLTCTVTMSAARAVAATFELQRFMLTVTIDRTLLGNGTVTSSPSGIACGTACSATFVAGTQVTLTATPAIGSVFTGWTGCDSVAGNVCTVAMASARSATAGFLGVSVQ